jgi:adenylosuccinate lyase
MPFKRNPINSENLDSLARYVAALPRVAWDNGAHSLLERTLDDSGNRRVVLPEAFLAADELLLRATKVVSGLRIDDEGVRRNLVKYGVFAATERLLMEAVQQGGDRQVLHEVIRQHSLTAWEAIRHDNENPLEQLLTNDARITAFVPREQVHELLQVEGYVGDAPERARRMTKTIRDTLRGDT